MYARTVRIGISACVAAVLATGATLLAQSNGTPPAAPDDAPPYCAVETSGTTVEMVRPRPDEPPIDDVNWFARPVPNPRGHWIVGYASHNLNYLYDLTTGDRVRVPDASDAVATPDGRYLTVPSHYTESGTVNFYDLPTLLARLERGEDAADVPPVFAHAHPDVADVYYQSVGVVSSGDDETGITVYRMMFSGGTHPSPPGFRIVDYTFTRRGGRTTVTPSRPMRLCPQIVKDMATPFISKDGRYVVAHDDGYPERPASLKIFELTGVEPERGTTTCETRVDFGFAAGKADFSFDGSSLTFHISKHAYLTPFVSGGIDAPTITDVVVVDLERDAEGRLTGYRGMTRVTTSAIEGVGNYFPAFFPDGRLFYMANEVPKGANAPTRYTFRVVDPTDEIRMANFFAQRTARERAAAIGELWRETCAPAQAPFKPREAEWAFMSLPAPACRRLVETHWTGSGPVRTALLDACDRTFLE